MHPSIESQIHVKQNDMKRSTLDWNIEYEEEFLKNTLVRREFTFTTNEIKCDQEDSSFFDGHRSGKCQGLTGWKHVDVEMNVKTLFGNVQW